MPEVSLLQHDENLSLPLKFLYGIEATKRHAQQTIFQPGINADIVNAAYACEPCQRLQPSQQQEPLMIKTNQQDHLCLCRLTFPVLLENTSWCVLTDSPNGQLSSLATSATTIRFIRYVFHDLGVPVHLRTDSGP